MKAYARFVYGGPEILKLVKVSRPSMNEDQVLVKIVANSANPADWRILRGKPFFARFTFGLLKPKYHIPGSDFSGIVEEIGMNVKGFKIGDKVFGSTLLGGAFAEYIAVSADACAKIPEQVGFSEMASVPIAGVTALEALVNHGCLQEGESVLINGSTGGVGHFAVQIAKAYGAKVTAVCSSSNVAFAKSLGADEVIAYDVEDIHLHEGKYDLIVDIHGNLSYEDYKRMGHRGVSVGFTNMKQMFSLLLKKAIGKFSISQFTVELNVQNLENVASLIQQGKVTPVIERTYSYKDIPEAISYIEGKHTKGKVTMNWENALA